MITQEKEKGCCHSNTLSIFVDFLNVMSILVSFLKTAFRLEDLWRDSADGRLPRRPLVESDVHSLSRRIVGGVNLDFSLISISWTHLAAFLDPSTLLRYSASVCPFYLSCRPPTVPPAAGAGGRPAEQ